MTTPDEDELEKHLQRLYALKQKRHKEIKAHLSELEKEVDPIIQERIQLYAEYQALKRQYGQEYKDKLIIGKLSSCTQRMNRINKTIRTYREELHND